MIFGTVFAVRFLSLRAFYTDWVLSRSYDISFEFLAMYLFKNALITQYIYYKLIGFSVGGKWLQFPISIL